MEDKYLKQTINVNNQSRSGSNASNRSNTSNFSSKSVDDILEIEKSNLHLIEITTLENIELRKENEELKIQINKYKKSQIDYILIIVIILSLTILFMHLFLSSFKMFLSVHKYSRLNFGCNIYLYYTNHSIIF